jgi:hypothetical protein
MEGRNSEPVSHGNGSTPSELATRLLASHYPYAPMERPPRLFVGSMPDEPPFEVPIPAWLTLVGSMVLEQPRGRLMTEIVLDSELPAERAHESYRELLVASGWSEDDRGRRESGGFARGPAGFLMFLSRVSPFSFSSRRSVYDFRRLSTAFRRDGRRETLIVSAEERRVSPTDVRIVLITGRPPCRRRRGDPEALYVIPLLTPPPRARRLEEHRPVGVLAPPFDARPGANTAAADRNPMARTRTWPSKRIWTSRASPATTPHSSKMPDGPVRTRE